MKIEKLVVASHNQGKIDEIKRMMVPFKVDVVSARELELPDVEETGTTFRENAALKANQLSEISGLPCLADDSGLCVDALGGRPGVYSARYAGPERDFDRAMEHLIEELRNSGSNDWSAHFSCVLALKIPGRECRFLRGRSKAKLFPKRADITVSVLIRYLSRTVLTRRLQILRQRKRPKFRTAAGHLRSFAGN